MADQDMHDLTGWVETNCHVSDAIRDSQTVKPGSSLTDLDGAYGKAVVYTEWETFGKPVLRDYRWPGDDNRECAHYVPAKQAGKDRADG